MRPASAVSGGGFFLNSSSTGAKSLSEKYQDELRFSDRLRSASLASADRSAPKRFREYLLFSDCGDSDLFIRQIPYLLKIYAARSSRERAASGKLKLVGIKKVLSQRESTF